MLPRSTIFFGCLLALGELSPAHATSIVAKLEKERIILAVDTRRSELDSLNPQYKFYDDGCKIVAFGPSGAAMSGNLDYKRNDPSDPVPNWSARGVALHDECNNAGVNRRQLSTHEKCDQTVGGKIGDLSRTGA
jgi:hypothetical protein